MANPWLLGLIPLAYLIGSIPFGLIVGLSKGIDPRTAGSKNIGATNVARLLGGKFFWVVFMLDLLKGLIPTLVAGAIVHFAPSRGDEYFLWLAVGVATIFGHMFSVFLRFKGGKGVATSAGVLLGVFPYYTVPGLLAIAVWVIIFLPSRYVSLASIIGVAVFPIAYAVTGLIMGWPILRQQVSLLIFAFLIAGLIIYKHRTNITRLLAGTENRFAKPPQAQHDV